MSLRGSLSTMPAQDVLEWVSRRRLTAPVTFERRGITRTLVVEDGEIVCACSNLRDEQLGTVLVRSGLIAERALTDALEARSETGVPLGKVVLLSGLTTEADVVAILATKIRETVTDIMAWRDGQFDVVPRARASVPGVNAQLSVDVCLTVAQRRAARMEAILNILGSDDATFYASPLASPPHQDPSAVIDPPPHSLVPRQGLPRVVGSAAHPGRAGLIDPASVWMHATNRLSAASIAATLMGERFATYDVLADMVETGVLMLERRRRERTNSAIELAAGARGRLRQGDRTAALAMAQQALQRDSDNPEVRAAFAQAERACVASVAKRLLARHCVPTRRCDITDEVRVAHHLSPTEVELAMRIDGRWDLMSLIRSATVREPDALLAVARLAELGLVELG